MLIVYAAGGGWRSRVTVATAGYRRQPCPTGFVPERRNEPESHGRRHVQAQESVFMSLEPQD